VITGRIAFRSSCRRKIRVGGSPFAFAVRMKSELMISSIDDRISLVRNAIVPRPRTIDGTIMCRVFPIRQRGAPHGPLQN
jgi:hypothetical protein